jgi:hypothetical protein
MRRSLFAGLACCLLLASAGCTMCAHNYDECGPTANGNCPQQCGTDVRAGSILSAAPAVAAGIDEMGSQPLPPSDETAKATVRPKQSTADTRTLASRELKTSRPAELSQGGL